MGSCTPRCKKWSTISVAIAFLILGIFFACFWGFIVDRILHYELGISSSSSIGYSMWKETPIPMYLSFYMFNWTNADECQKNASVKPKFVQLGPYVFWEHHVREDVKFNDNNTVTFYNRRMWQFEASKTNGSLDDNVSTLNPIVASVASLVKDKHYLVQLGVNFFLEEKKVPLAVTKTVREFLFDGYDDPMLDLMHKLNISGIDIPFKKMGWFVDRNNSKTYDGLYNMNDGKDSLRNLGIVRRWNYYEQVPYYNGTCGKVEGTQGELWYPPQEDTLIKIFSNDLCSTLDLTRAEEHTIHGITGFKFVGNERTFDNGSLYPDMKCFSDRPLYTGIRDVSLCKYGAPAYVSFPHFYLADPFYRESLEGMAPNKDEHEMFLAIEPKSGIPLEVKAQVQINLQLYHVEHIDLLSVINSTLMPAFWFSQSAVLSGDLSETVKTVLILPDIGQYTGFGLLGIGVLISAVAILVTCRSGWRESEEEQLLRRNEL